MRWFTLLDYPPVFIQLLIITYVHLRDMSRRSYKIDPREHIVIGVEFLQASKVHYLCFIVRKVEFVYVLINMVRIKLDVI